MTERDTRRHAPPIDPGVGAWLASAEADADRRGLSQLKPTLRAFARMTDALRAADWNVLASSGCPAGPAGDDGD